MLISLLLAGALIGRAQDCYDRAEEAYYGARYGEAIRICLEGLSTKDITEEEAVELYSILGTSYARLGAFDKAADYMVRCYEYDVRNGEAKGLTSSLINLASVYVYAGKPEMAEEYALEAIRNEESVGRPDKLAMACGKACDVYHALGRDSLALAWADNAVTLAQDKLDSLAVAVRRSQRAYPLEALGMYSQAKRDLAYAEEVFRRKGVRQSLAIVCFQLGQEYGRTGQQERERRYYQEAATLAREVQDLPLLQKICNSLAKTLKDKQPKQALAWLEESADIQAQISKNQSANALELFNIEHQTEQLEHSLALKEQELERQRKARTAMAIIAILLLAGAMVAVFIARRIKKSELELRKTNRQKDFLLRVISHDILSPAVAQLRGIQLLRESAGRLSPDQVKDVALQLERQAGAEVELIENALRWSKSQNGAEPAQAVRFNLAELVREVASQYDASALAKQISLNIDAPHELVVCSNRSNLMLALRNILSNAIKFSHRGGYINISVSAISDGADVKVRDSGIGIPADKLDTLFSIQEAFRRQGTDGEPTNGLGLVVSKALLEACGSSISVQSTEGEGSTFTLQIRNCDGRA